MLPATEPRLVHWAQCHSCQPERPLRGPRKSHRINPNSGSSKTTSIQMSFFPLLAELWAMLRIAQMSPASTRRPSIPLYPKFIFVFPSNVFRFELELTRFRRRISASSASSRPPAMSALGQSVQTLEVPLSVDFKH